MGSLTLTTERLILREFVEDDWGTVYEMACEPVITRYQSLLQLGSEEEARHWTQNCIFHNNVRPRNAYNLLLVERDHNRSLGWIGWGKASDPTKGEHGFGYALLPEFWGRGYMTEALHAALEFMFEELGAQSVSDYCERTNQASARVMEKAGLSLAELWMEGIESGSMVEYARYVIRREDWKQPSSLDSAAVPGL